MGMGVTTPPHPLPSCSPKWLQYDIALWSPCLSFFLRRVLPVKPAVTEFCWWTGYRAVSPPPRTAQNSKFKSRPQKQMNSSKAFLWGYPFLFFKNKRLFISSEGFSAMEKAPWCVLKGQCCPSSRVWQAMAVWRIFFFFWTCWVGCDSSLHADSNGRLARFIEERAPNH